MQNPGVAMALVLACGLGWVNMGRVLVASGSFGLRRSARIWHTHVVVGQGAGRGIRAPLKYLLNANECDFPRFESWLGLVGIVNDEF